MRILAIADEVDEGLYGEKLKRLRPELVLSAGDLSFEYLEYIVSRLDVPLLYVPGNHDRDLSPGDSIWAPLAPSGRRAGRGVASTSTVGTSTRPVCGSQGSAARTAIARARTSTPREQCAAGR